MLAFPEVREDTSCAQGTLVSKGLSVERKLHGRVVPMLTAAPWALAGLREHAATRQRARQQLGEEWKEEKRMDLSQGTMRQSHGSLQKELGTVDGSCLWQSLRKIERALEVLAQYHSNHLIDTDCHFCHYGCYSYVICSPVVQSLLMVELSAKKEMFFLQCLLCGY